MKRLSIAAVLLLTSLLSAQSVSVQNLTIVEAMNPVTGYHLLNPFCDYKCTSAGGATIVVEWKLTTQPQTSYVGFASGWFPPTAVWSNVLVPPHQPLPLNYWPAPGVPIHIRVTVYAQGVGGTIQATQTITYIIKL